MAIGMAQQKGSTVYVYDDKNHQIWTEFGQLHGYTGTIVTIKKSSTLYMYDEKHHVTGTHSC